MYWPGFLFVFYTNFFDFGFETWCLFKYLPKAVSNASKAKNAQVDFFSVHDRQVI
ncbi:MAG: hypothetical protein RLZZ123_1229 [Pseudomonadota bacterium]